MLIGAKTIATFFALIALAGGQLRGEVAPPPTGISVAVVGDSYAAGVGATPTRAWQHYAALELGWFVESVRAYPGAGYVNRGTYQPYEVALALDPLPPTVSQVVVQGGFNDIAYEPAQVGAAVTRTLALIHAQAPLAEVTVVGMFDPGPGTFTGSYPNMLANAEAIRQAVVAAGDRYVDGLPMRYEVGPDRAHPTATGHAELGHAVAGAIRVSVPGAVPHRTGALNSRQAAVIGVSRVGPHGGRWFHLASTQGGQLGPVATMTFGEAGDVPGLLPDASGRCMPAVYRPSTGILYAASDLVDGGGVVEAVPVGRPGDQLVQNGSSASPWGRAVILRRPSQSAFVEQVPGPSGPDAGSLVLGRPGDRGFLYSATGTGTTLGVHRSETSTFFIAEPAARSATAVTAIPFGNPGDQGLVGAWGWSDVDGSDRVGVFRPATAQWFLAGGSLTAGVATPTTEVTSFVFGDPGDTALACDPV
ncbi:SGNH/GDSL hydrolase family protein [Blastococcus sp. TF02A-30]|uniref:SGNH/GDSL hydrolase family protein n=1 Tax=Blastococcus sp. TF02A-30 TaxID=2250580 RepID=UPI0013140A84|nr:SGNH/GDSL hydrolase family protein [Blastococcus sp. TF02A-30]